MQEKRIALLRLSCKKLKLLAQLIHDFAFLSKYKEHIFIQNVHIESELWKKIDWKNNKYQLIPYIESMSIDVTFLSEDP